VLRARGQGGRKAAEGRRGRAAAAAARRKARRAVRRGVARCRWGAGAAAAADWATALHAATEFDQHALCFIQLGMRVTYTRTYLHRESIEELLC
jgi:hypothetical protein